VETGGPSAIGFDCVGLLSRPLLASPSFGRTTALDWREPRLPHQDKLRASGYPGEESEKTPRSGPVSTIEELVARHAHDVNNPLAVVVANIEVLAEMISGMGVESGTYLETPEAKRWLASHLGETEVCLHDVREAAERIRAVVRQMKEQVAPKARLLGVVRTPAESVRAPKAEQAFEPEPTTGVIRCARVLVVDDEVMVANALARCLRDYDVVVMVSAREALERVVNGERFDIILCDLMMPEMTGSVLYDEINRLAPDQAERMVFVTGGATTPQAQEFLATVGQPC